MNDRCLDIPWFVWCMLLRQLRRRSAGTRESGAFLVGDRGTTRDRVRRFICYDDLDPLSLRGGYVEFRSNGYAALWQYCRRMDMDVLADVHTHPGCDSRQSETDRLHPMISEVGHIAIILPNFGRIGLFQTRDLSIYEYSGNYQWRNWTETRDQCRVRHTIW